MEVEEVVLEIGQFAQVPLQPGYGEVLASHIDHQAALGIGGPVAGRAAAQGSALPQQLEERARAVEDAIGGACADRHVRTDLQKIALLAQFGLICRQAEYKIAGSGIGGVKQRNIQAAEQLQVLDQHHPGLA